MAVLRLFGGARHCSDKREIWHEERTVPHAKFYVYRAERWESTIPLVVCRLSVPFLHRTQTDEFSVKPKYFAPFNSMDSSSLC